jgi:hypothetical protein
VTADNALQTNHWICVNSTLTYDVEETCIMFWKTFHHMIRFASDDDYTVLMEKMDVEMSQFILRYVGCNHYSLHMD